MAKGFPFKLLTEQASIVDKFANKVHDKLADSISKLVLNNDNGFILGLEGKYGIGKSTVVTFLKEMFSSKGKYKNHEIITYYFDAWAHEGGPLKRTFLEGLINSFLSDFRVDKRCIEELEQLKNKISGKYKAKETKKTAGVTLTGFLSAIGALLLPLGIMILGSLDPAEYQVFGGDSFHLTALLGFLLVGSSIIFLGIYYFILHLKWGYYAIIEYKKSSAFKSFLDNVKNEYIQIYAPDKWNVFNSNSNEVITETTNSEIENTSIEFETYFKDILAQIYQESPKFKLIIILDNIDRIHSNDTHKLISILQSFLLANENLRSGYNELFKRIFAVIPYDITALTSNLGSDNNDAMNSFLKKTVQVRLNVPSSASKDWLKTSKTFIENSFSDWNREDIDDVIEIFQGMYSDPKIIPTPRDIKLFINQVGVLRNHHSDQIISTSVISYYVIKRFLMDEKTPFEEQLVSSDFPTNTEKLLISNPNFKNELAAILFDVNNLTDAYTILLEEPIRVALRNNEKENLIKLEKEHNQNFWRVLHYIIIGLNHDDLILFSNTLGESFNKLLREKIPKFQSSINTLLRDFNVSKINIDPFRIDRFTLNIASIINQSSCELAYIDKFWAAIISKGLIEELISQGDKVISEKRILAFHNSYMMIDRDIREKLSRVEVEDISFPWHTLAKLDYEKKLSFIKIISTKKELAINFVEKHITKENNVIEIPYVIILFHKFSFLNDQEALKMLSELQKVSNAPDNFYNDEHVILLGQEFYDLMYYLVVKINPKESIKNIFRQKETLKNTVIHDNKNLEYKINLILGFTYLNRIDDFYFNDIPKNSVSWKNYFYEIDEDFVSLFKEEVIYHNKQIDFWKMCLNTKNVACFEIIKRSFNENDLGILYEEQDMWELLIGINLILKNEKNIHDKKDLTHWLIDNISHPGNDDPNLANKYHLIMEDNDFLPDEFKEAFIEVYGFKKYIS
jgi:hypothetical protein